MVRYDGTSSLALKKKKNNTKMRVICGGRHAPRQESPKDHFFNKISSQAKNQNITQEKSHRIQGFHRSLDLWKRAWLRGGFFSHFMYLHRGHKQRLAERKQKGQKKMRRSMMILATPSPSRKRITAII